MSRREFSLTVQPNPSPRYPSIEAALADNLQLIVALIKAGQVTQLPQPTPVNGEHVEIEAKSA